ncbi:hypothetical protein FHS29_004818 [Saccharothrix tamanrassetensis]|uniref:Uncharacterized protein n=1 Tax=Saccharothrix tamanrassetensis TaxID=1051531 RepID=A0A841CM69_9PSEU|nr:hypothetical protein [Saccharothrix tamanrassetensis]MBB5958210.1 hypothetical protein [Saccharothrix tamanrassetensis]
MGNIRKIIIALIAATVGIATTAQAVAETRPRFTRIDTDATGAPESAGGREFIELSGNGRYALFSVRTNSNMVPEQYRTDRPLGTFLVRKDLRTGGTLLASVKEDGSPMRADWRYSAIGWDGTTFAYSNDDSGLDPGYRGGVFHRDVATGVRRVATMPERWFFDAIDLSADGRWLTWAGLDEEDGQNNRIHRHDLVTGETTTPTLCAGCWRSHGPVVSDDGTKLLFLYQTRSDDSSRLAVLDATTGDMHALPEGGAHTLSGDGAWVFYVVTTGDYRFELKKISTAPGATPVVLRTWGEDTVTWTAGVTSSNRNGDLVGSYWFSRAQDTFADSRALVHDQRTGREITLPEPRPGTAFVTNPAISRDSRLAVVEERCPWVTECGPLGIYAIPLRGLIPARD